MTEQVERDGYDQFWDVVESAPVHQGHIAQPIDALRSAWLVRDLTEDDFRAARAAIAALSSCLAMPKLNGTRLWRTSWLATGPKVLNITKAGLNLNTWPSRVFRPASRAGKQSRWIQRES